MKQWNEPQIITLGAENTEKYEHGKKFDGGFCDEPSGLHNPLGS